MRERWWVLLLIVCAVAVGAYFYFESGSDTDTDTDAASDSDSDPFGTDDNDLGDGGEDVDSQQDRTSIITKLLKGLARNENTASSHNNPYGLISGGDLGSSPSPSSQGGMTTIANFSSVQKATDYAVGVMNRLIGDVGGDDNTTILQAISAWVLGPNDPRVASGIGLPAGVVNEAKFAAQSVGGDIHDTISSLLGGNG